MSQRICWLILLLSLITSQLKAKPNVVFIYTDDQAPFAVNAAGDSRFITPNIDRIFHEGAHLKNSFVTTPVCSPSRVGLITSRYGSEFSITDWINPGNEKQLGLPKDALTFPALFQKAGYQTAMYGKLHFGNNPKGVDDFLILPGQGDYINPKFLGKEKDTVITGYVSDVITDLTLNWFKTKRDKNKPFMMMYLHKAPHRAWWPSPEKFAEFYEKKFPEPETLFDDYSNRGTAAKTAEMNLLTHMQYMHDSKVRPDVIEEMGKVEPEIVYVRGDGTLMRPNASGFNRPFGRANEEQKKKYDVTLDKISADFKENWPKMNDEEKMRWKFQRYMQDYLATISSVDDNVGRVLDYLEETGLDDNTIVCLLYTSDAADE